MDIGYDGKVASDTIYPIKCRQVFLLSLSIVARYPATLFPASRNTLSCAGITAKPSLRLSRITDSSAIA